MYTNISQISTVPVWFHKASFTVFIIITDKETHVNNFNISYHSVYTAWTTDSD